MNQPTGSALQLWQIPLTVSAATVARYSLCLSADEIARADRFRFAHDRRKFIVARGTLRYLLGGELGRSPQSIRFDYGDYGKPQVSITTVSPSAACGFHFNLSHSGELALCALGGSHRVGVDIEIIKTIQRLESMMSRCLCPEEIAQVAASEDPVRAFLQYWTCKEAYLKAIGKGLSQSMQSVKVQLRPPLLLQVPDRGLASWHLHPVSLPTGYVGAVVVEGTVSLELNEWRHSIPSDFSVTSP
ncbi:MAG: 4'-phosphopantetheinyl transferase AcpT [Phormidesmis priestleyi Ana]|uniref:4'-phosphopantetheinyl transferase AcpT n=1 Tax=Phormidesmis priestleyi Ana TaxID=1666911 RepID=A0A0P8DD59_9CYAN|nr:MAG: 4'-phosphopantetheinyl transferase AcpT [Phormidesmis priestleyi Ana]